MDTGPMNYIIILKYNLRGPIKMILEFLRINNDFYPNIKNCNEAILRVDTP
jgi:hypothetical protein